MEPHGAVVSGKGPLTNPDGILDPGGLRQDERIDLRVLVDGQKMRPEEHVQMGVHHNVVHVVVLEKAVPEKA